MNCPRCGLYVEDTRTAQCPRCGWNLSAMPGYQSPTQQYPDAAPPDPSQFSGAYGQNPYGYGAPAVPSMPTSSSPYGPPYGPVQGPYGQPATSSTPLYQPGAPSGFAPWQAGNPPQGPQPPYWAPQPPKKRSAAPIIIAVAIVGVLVLVGLSGVGLAFYRSHQNNQSRHGAPVAGATPSPTANILFQDHFTDKTTGWSNSSHCFYGSGGYHIKGSYICLAPTDDFTDATITTDVKQISGSILSAYGITFRTQTNFDHYEFDIDSNGKWVLMRCVSDKCDRLVDFTANSAIHKGLNISNKLQVTTKGSQFTFYVNSVKVGEFTDSKFASGAVGLTGADQLEVVYNNFVVTSPS